jgi:hypothetical protein
MATDPRKRQKKLERRKAKVKAERRELAKREPQGLPARMRQASAAPILHCYVSSELWRQGIGHVMVSRQLPAGMVAFAAFLVDRYCLGVKNAFANIAPRSRYDADMVGKLARQGELIKVQPEYARKLVESAVQFADKLGLSPHEDYHAAKLIFGEIDAEACDEEFTFGKDGKPFFMAGPYDGPARCTQIVRTLHSHCGPGGYHYLMPAEGLLPDDLLELTD